MYSDNEKWQKSKYSKTLVSRRKMMISTGKIDIVRYYITPIFFLLLFLTLYQWMLLLLVVFFHRWCCIATERVHCHFWWWILWFWEHMPSCALKSQEFQIQSSVIFDPPWETPSFLLLWTLYAIPFNSNAFHLLYYIKEDYRPRKRIIRKESELMEKSRQWMVISKWWQDLEGTFQTRSDIITITFLVFSSSALRNYLLFSNLSMTTREGPSGRVHSTPNIFKVWSFEGLRT